MYFEKDGAFTGEISGAMLVDCGCQVRHPRPQRAPSRPRRDRRSSSIRKIKAAFAAGLTPIFCVGELLEEREGGLTESVVERQCPKGLEGVSADPAARIVVAYEPVWAIGTGRNATPDAGQRRASLHARRILASMYDKATADAVCIQYGGSVKPENAFELMKQSEIDGALVGGASLKAEVFSAIITEAAKVLN